MTTQSFLLDDVLAGHFDRGIDARGLWAAAARKKVKTELISNVKHWTYSPCWSTADDCFVSPRQVIAQPEKFPDHIARIRRADLTYPLIVVEDEYDKYGTILDGNHRFTRMVMEGKRVVKFVYFSRAEIKKLIA